MQIFIHFRSEIVKLLFSIFEIKLSECVLTTSSWILRLKEVIVLFSVSVLNTSELLNLVILSVANDVKFNAFEASASTVPWLYTG